MKIPIERIPNRRDQDYFYEYKNVELEQISWYQQLLNFISRCLYFMTGPKFIVPILGIVKKSKAFKIQITFGVLFEN